MNNLCKNVYLWLSDLCVLRVDFKISQWDWGAVEGFKLTGEVFYAVHLFLTLDTFDNVMQHEGSRNS